MFVFSREQLKSFLSILSKKDQTNVASDVQQYHQTSNGDFNCYIDKPQFDSLLDLGAGDGNVTKTISEHFQKTFVTEMSCFMQTRLLRRKFNLLGIDDWHLNDIKFDMISCLNVLDRYEIFGSAFF